MKTKEEILKKQLNAEDRPITDYIGINGYVWNMILNAMEEYAQQQVKLFAIPDVSNRRELLCGFFEPKNDSSSATICKHCGREKWMHPKAT